MSKKKIVVAIAGFILLSLVFIMFVSNVATKNKKLASKGKIAVIYVDGVIMGGRTQNIFNEYNGTDEVMKQIRDAKEDETVKVVVLRINSPGGSTPATQEVGEEIQKLRATGKPVVASMGDVAASGGYWLAAVTDKIYANPATMTGSIGVYMPYSNWQELYKKVGISNEKIKSGVHKDILSPDRPMTNAERAMIQVMVDDIYEQFVKVVSEGRKIDAQRVRELADGRIYTGNQAKAVGLVDELGNFYDAIDGAAKLAGIQGKPEIKEYGKSSPFSMLLGSNSRMEVEQLLLNYLTKEMTNMSNIAPMAMPEKW